MTTEEKARAYDEAIKKAKEIKEKIVHSHLSTESCNAVSEYIDTIIPELVESEDERIRKWMINQLSAVINTESAKEFDPTGYEMAIKALSWLEKQKINTEGDFGRGYDCGYEACLNSHEAEWFEKQKEIPMSDSTKMIEMWDEEKKILERMYLRGDTWRLIAYNAFMDGFARGNLVKFEKQKEQSITAKDLDEEIRRFFDDCIDVYEAKLYGSISERVIPVDCYELTARHFAKWGERQKEQEHICDSTQYEEGFKTGLEIGLRNQKEQKSTECEKDERIRKQLINVCNDYLNGDYSAKPCLNDIKWLKKLLEKQKEQKPVKCELEDAFKYYTDAGITVSCGDIVAKPKEQKPVECDKETDIQKAFREGQNAGRQEVFDHPGAYGLEMIDNVFGFRIGDTVRLVDGDGRPHIIKYFEKIEGLHGPDFYRVVFEDNTASDCIIPGDEYPNGYFTCMEKIDGQKEQKPKRERNKPKESWLSKAKYELAHEEELLIKRQKELSEIRALKNKEQKSINSKKPKEYKSSEDVEMIVMSPYEAEFCQKFCDHTPDHYSPDGWKLIKNYYAEFKEIVMRELAEQKSASYSPLCNTIKDKIREYVANHFIAEDITSIVEAMEEGVRLGKEEQKPAEWSEEDREMLIRCVAAIPVQGDEILPTSYLNKLRNWLESLPERFNLQSKQEWSEEDKDYYDTIVRKLEVIGDDSGLSNNQIKFLRKHCPSHYLEWSEEDERMLHGIEQCVYDNVVNIGTVNKVKYIDFLSSLRPDSYKNCNSQWKPSEEQMQALNTVLEHEAERVGSSKELEKANALYEQLKKRI